jgi:hypothetical protein
LLLRQFDERNGPTRQFANVLDDPRDPELTEHTFLGIVRSRAFGILAGYEDQNDHDTLRTDPVFKLIADRSHEDGYLDDQVDDSLFARSGLADRVISLSSKHSHRLSEGVSDSRSAPLGWGSSVRSSNPCRVRIRTGAASDDGVAGGRVKPRCETPAPGSFGHPNDCSAKYVHLGTFVGIVYWTGRESGQRCRTIT